MCNFCSFHTPSSPPPLFLSMVQGYSVIAPPGVNVLEEENANGHKAVAKLMRTAQKVKETLSANKDAKASVWASRRPQPSFKRSEVVGLPSLKISGKL